MDPSQLLAGRTRETRIRRDERGRWWNGADAIEHPGLVQSFDGWIERAEDGRLCLSNDINWAYVEVEGPPYFVRSLELTPEGVLLTLSGGLRELLDPSTLRQDARGALFCDVRGGRLAARFDNHAATRLAEWVDEDADGVYLRLDGRVVRPRVVDDPLLPSHP